MLIINIQRNMLMQKEAQNEWLSELPRSRSDRFSLGILCTPYWLNLLTESPTQVDTARGIGFYFRWVNPLADNNKGAQYWVDAR